MIDLRPEISCCELIYLICKAIRRFLADLMKHNEMCKLANSLEFRGLFLG